MATKYQSAALWGSISYTKTSATAGFLVPPSLAQCVNNNRSSLLNFRTAHWCPKIFVRKNYKFEILQTRKFPDLRYLKSFVEQIVAHNQSNHFRSHKTLTGVTHTFLFIITILFCALAQELGLCQTFRNHMREQKRSDHAQWTFLLLM